MTLIEVIVVVAIVGMIASVTALSLPRILTVPPTDPGRVLAETRRLALQDGVARTARLMIDSVAYELVALPDGSVVADSGVPLDRFTSRWRHAP
jgi:prepilin-type N-terminal cleavage/methylation domain-containing protein